MLSGRQLGASLFVFLFSFLLISSTANAGLKWQYHADAPIVGSPIIYLGYAYLMSEEGSLFVLDTANGIQAYPYSIGEKTHIAPSLGGKYLMLAADSGNIIALDIIGKKKAWQYSNARKNSFSVVSGQTGAVQDYQQNAIGAPSQNSSIVAIASGGGFVFISYTDSLVALDEGTGKEVWNRQMSEGGQIGVDDYSVYVQNGQYLNAYGMRDGALLWRTQTGRAFLTSPNPMPQKSKVLVGNTDGQVIAIDARSGKPDWIYQAGGWIMSTPNLVGDVVVFGTNSNEAIAVDADGGMLRWKAETDGPIWAKPIGAGEGREKLVVFGANDRKIYGVSAQDGKTAWSYLATDWVFGGSTEDGRDVVFGSQDGEIWAVTVSPFCTITNLENGQLVGDKFEISGTSYAESGVGSTRVSAGPIDFPPIAGKAEWSVLADVSALQDGSVPIRCTVTDLRGLEEGDRSAKVIVTKSIRAPRRTMAITPPSNAEPEAAAKIFVRDADGFDLSELLVTVEGAGVNDSYGDAKSPVEIKVPSKDGEYIIVAKKFGYEKAEGTMAVRTNTGPIIALGAIVLVGIGIAAFAVFKMFTKKERKI